MDDNIPDDCQGTYHETPWNEVEDNPDLDFCTCGRLKDFEDEACNKCLHLIDCFDESL